MLRAFAAAPLASRSNRNQWMPALASIVPSALRLTGTVTPPLSTSFSHHEFPQAQRCATGPVMFHRTRGTGAGGHTEPPGDRGRSGRAGGIIASPSGSTRGSTSPVVSVSMLGGCVGRRARLPASAGARLELLISRRDLERGGASHGTRCQALGSSQVGEPPEPVPTSGGWPSPAFFFFGGGLSGLV